MCLAIALILLFVLEETDKVQFLLQGIRELFEYDLTTSSFFVYCVILAIILDLVIITFYRKHEDYEAVIWIGIMGVIVYHIDFMYQNILTGINEIFGKDLSLNGYVILCIILAILYEAVNVIELKRHR